MVLPRSATSETLKNPFVWIMNWYINIIPSTFALSYFCPVVYNLSPCHKLSIALLPFSWFAYLEGDIKEVDKQILCFPEYFVKHTSKSVLTFNDLHQFSSGPMCSFFVVITCICFGYKFSCSFDWVRFKICESFKMHPNLQMAPFYPLSCPRKLKLPFSHVQ